ncbi:hypothetical protein KEM56_001863, partial [Ascosphaera pollenicola]
VHYDSTAFVTKEVTITSCGPEVTDCPASSTVVSNTVVPNVPVTTAGVEPTSVPVGQTPGQASQSVGGAPPVYSAPARVVSHPAGGDNVAPTTAIAVAPTPSQPAGGDNGPRYPAAASSIVPGGATGVRTLGTATGLHTASQPSASLQASHPPLPFSNGASSMKAGSLFVCALVGLLQLF